MLVSHSLKMGHYFLQKLNATCSDLLRAEFLETLEPVPWTHYDHPSSNLVAAGQLHLPAEF